MRSRIVVYFYTFTTAFSLISRFALILLRIRLTLLIYPSLQAWRFKRKAGAYIKGECLNRLAFIYRDSLKRALQQLTGARWLELESTFSWRKARASQES